MSANDNPPNHDDEYWRRKLSPEQYAVLREGATEAPFSGLLNVSKERGVYKCAGCGEVLFSSDTKYDSGSGWPSFYAAVEEGRIAESRDSSHAMVRTEISCSNCGGHLGHVFPDGPEPSGLRYCVNSLSLDFEAEDGESGD